jgi:hypothetical protein
VDLPWNLRPLDFDHSAAFEASWAIEDLITRLDVAATNRARVAEHILSSCEGPFADHLRQQVTSAGADTAEVVSGLRRLQSQIDDAREAALVEDVRRQLAANEWKREQTAAREIEALATRALSSIGSPVAPSDPPTLLPV